MAGISMQLKHIFSFIFSLVIVLVFATGLLAFVRLAGNKEGSVLAQQDVTIQATVQACDLYITAHPEKRIPRTNNWGTILDVEIHDRFGNYVGTVVGVSDSSGDAIINVCNQGLYLADGQYDVYARGLSHLRRGYDDLSAFRTAGSFMDLTQGGIVELFAGETSNVYDNFINTLDLSTQITTMETTDVKNDLNQDGEVNVLDIANTVTNFFLAGECSPREISVGVCN